jgi:hypothetical protein
LDVISKHQSCSSNDILCGAFRMEVIDEPEALATKK